FNRLVCGWFGVKSVGLFQHFFTTSTGFTGMYADGWIGPLFEKKLALRADAKELEVTVRHTPSRRHRRIKVSLLLDGRPVASKATRHAGSLTLTADLAKYSENVHMELRCSSFFVPRKWSKCDDHRRLSVKLDEKDISVS